jgi:hypothetical protein
MIMGADARRERLFELLAHRARSPPAGDTDARSWFTVVLCHSATALLGSDKLFTVKLSTPEPHRTAPAA